MSRSWRALPTGLPVLDARNDFARARRAHAAGRFVRRRRRGSDRRSPGCAGAASGGRPRLEVLPLAAIAGAVEESAGFDAELRPASEHVRARWERVALAHRLGIAVPPISVIQCADGYYVLDGRHRVSVARALGIRDIDAWVSRPAVSSDPVPACS